MLLDSNIIIYASDIKYQFLQKFIDDTDSVVSIITKVEVLGYHNLSPSNRNKLMEFFSMLPILPLSDAIIEIAIDLRQKRKMSLGDALIAATALEYKLDLVTANIKDFSWIENLQLINPL